MSSENGINGIRRKRSEIDDTVTLDEFMEESEHWRDTAVAVLGGSDNENCSYDQGYVKRQALYSCLTCIPVGAEPYTAAGVCLACSIKCHDGHDLVELYTKRNFRCDCGNKKFPSPSSPCLLQPVKSDYNLDNKYNHNFQGLYCVCDRPYPDPEEDEDEDDDDGMIQCVGCEDWFHGNHTENDSIDLASDLTGTSDFICASCTKKYGDILGHYEALMLKTSVASDVSAAGDDCGASTGDVTDSAEKSHPTCQFSDAAKTTLGNGGDGKGNCDAEEGSQDSGIASTHEADICEEVVVISAVASSVISEAPPEVICESDFCYLESRTAAAAKITLSGGTWWSPNWRTKLCKCKKCLAKYRTIGVDFLVDSEDTLEVYEAKGRQNDLENPGSEEELITQALAGLNHVQKIEVVHGFNEMKDGLVELVNRIGATGRAVTSEDINAFFAEMRANKRRRLDVYVPDNCR